MAKKKDSTATTPTLEFEYRVRWKADKKTYTSTSQTATFQTFKGAHRHYIKIGPEPWKAWGFGPLDEFHVDGCGGFDGGGDCHDTCPGTWEEAFKDRKVPMYREIVRRSVGSWEFTNLFREDGTVFTCLADDDVAEFIVERSGVQPGTPSGPEVHWAEGILRCPSCGAEEPYTTSSD